MDGGGLLSNLAYGFNYAPWTRPQGGRPPKKGKGVDIHKAIGKLPKPKGGFTLPGHNFTGPYNPLEQQLRYDPTTGEILEFYVNPTGKTDAIAAQHDVDYSVCGNDRRCKNKADRKMVKSLDAIPWNERQWGRFQRTPRRHQLVGLDPADNQHRQNRLGKTWQRSCFFTLLQAKQRKPSSKTMPASLLMRSNNNNNKMRAKIIDI